jgi:hypothetical protein
MEDNELKIKEMQMQYMWVKWLSVFLIVLSFVSLGLGLSLHMLVFLGCSTIMMLILLIIIKIYDLVIRKKTNIIIGYYIENNVKYIVDSKGKVVKKIEGELVFKEKN